MEAIRLRIESAEGREFDQIIAEKQDGKKVYLRFRSKKITSKDGTTYITGSRPDIQTMTALGMDTYEGVKQIGEIKKIRFEDKKGELVPIPARKISIYFPFRREEVVLFTTSDIGD